MASMLPFLEPPDCNAIQLVVVTGIYGYVLFTAANMIGDGSELLLLVPSLAGVVGSVVLPVLGAVPDGVMVFFSGMGPDAQEQVAVGVGALAGSTIMLLTIPWALAIIGGRVSIDHGKPKYSHPKIKDEENITIYNTGVGVCGSIGKSGRVMLLTSLLYWVIQAPTFLWASESHQSLEEKSSIVQNYAMVGLVLCVVCFFSYLAYQFLLAGEKEKEDQHDVNQKVIDVRVRAIKKGEITLRGIMYNIGHTNSAATGTDLERNALRDRLLQPDECHGSEMRQLLKPFFNYYDINHDNSLSRCEFSKVMADLNESRPEIEETALFNGADKDISGKIDFEEFVELMVRYVTGSFGRSWSKRTFVPTQTFADGDSEVEDEDDEEVPEDLANLDPHEQQRRIRFRAAWLMGLGTLLVLVFSDPAVDVLSEIGKRLNVSAFYVSFLLAPLASNASELVAAYNYASKKTQKSMTIALSTLLGAACMNNTFCLGIFFALVYFRKLAWTFSAETLCILFVEYVMFVFATKRVMYQYTAYIVLAIYPLSIAFVWILENILHMP